MTTSADTETPGSGDMNEPDGVSEMLKRREQRKSRQGRKPRTLPEPHHPRLPAKDDTADEPHMEENAVASDNAVTASEAPEPAAVHLGTGQASSMSPVADEMAKTASDAALSWAAAARKQALRLDGLASVVRRARTGGVPLPVLSAALANAEYRAGLPLPPEVWAEAGSHKPAGA